MEKQRGTVVAVIAALVVAVISLGVAFAAFSTTLNINGTATVTAATWDVHFTGDSSGNTTTTTVDATTTTGTVQDNSLITALTSTDFTWSAILKSPGDSITYKFYVTNQGNFDAKVSNVITPGVTCTTGSPATNETTYCGRISYTVTDGTNAITQNWQLAAGQTKPVWVTVTLNDYTVGDNAINTPPSSDITVTANHIGIIFSQDGGYVAPVTP